PLEYAQGSQDALAAVTLYFARLVLGVQLVIAGVQLPSKYLSREWKSLALLLGPGMIGMWLCSSLIIWGLIPDLPFLHALAVGACVTPTDPVLSNTIVKGKFADKNIPKELQRIIIAESGANDGLGYPFLFLALYLIKYIGSSSGNGGSGTAIGLWVAETLGYQILLGTLYEQYQSPSPRVVPVSPKLPRWEFEHESTSPNSAIDTLSVAIQLLEDLLVSLQMTLACRPDQRDSNSELSPNKAMFS
ncbi:MAG: hypothetical protein LQ340_006642, partial [Diploschistes diacapsis]